MLCLKIVEWVVANSVNPDETPRSAASNLGLHCLLWHVCPNTYGKYGNIQRTKSIQTTWFYLFILFYFYFFYFFLFFFFFSFCVLLLLFCLLVCCCCWWWWCFWLLLLYAVVVVVVVSNKNKAWFLCESSAVLFCLPNDANDKLSQVSQKIFKENKMSSSALCLISHVTAIFYIYIYKRSTDGQVKWRSSKKFPNPTH